MRIALIVRLMGDDGGGGRRGVVITLPIAHFTPTTPATVTPVLLLVVIAIVVPNVVTCYYPTLPHTPSPVGGVPALPTTPHLPPYCNYYWLLLFACGLITQQLVG